jgi:membrane-bound serine protease (ClpP class)
VDSAIKIRDRIVRSPIRSYTYVNNMAISAGSFIALATETIVMGEASNIGGALPIELGVGGSTEVDEKFISVFSSEMRKTAKHRGHPVQIAEGFCNPDLEIPGLKEKGKILTLDYDQATSHGLAAYVAPTLRDLLDREGFAQARIERFKPTWTDVVARWLSTPAIAGLLMLIGIAGIIVEVKSPGFGVPGIVGLIALGLYFFGAYLANLSGFMEIIFFVIGLILLIVEIYVIPGFGIVGIAGIGLMAGSLFFALFNLAPAGFDFNLSRLHAPLLTMLVGVMGIVPVILFLDRLLPHTPLYGRIALQPPTRPPNPATGDASAQPAVPLKAGDRGEALTDLRPSGAAQIAGRRVDVMTEGGYVAHGSPIEIVRIEGNKVIVRVE